MDINTTLITLVISAIFISLVIIGLILTDRWTDKMDAKHLKELENEYFCLCCEREVEDIYEPCCKSCKCSSTTYSSTHVSKRKTNK